MEKLTRQAENEKFQEWWLKDGYRYANKINPIRAKEWNILLKHWAWNAWEARASQFLEVK